MERTPMAGKANEVEKIVLAKGYRGLNRLLPFLPENFCDHAAGLIPTQPGTVFIITGFYISAAGAPETDGPPGALAVGRALRKMDYQVHYVTDPFSASLLQGLLDGKDLVITFPLTDEPASEQFARDLLHRYQPSLVIAIERCGRTADGLYLNSQGKDISSFNAKTDYLFYHHNRTIGIGDLGNEIGMGNLAKVLPTMEGLPRNPCMTQTTQLIVATVSNWGGYGLIASLSKRLKRNLLPSQEEENKLLEKHIKLGAVDGLERKRVCKVDGFSLEENGEFLFRLHQVLEKQGIQRG